jgi:hypothetical protein
MLSRRSFLQKTTLLPLAAWVVACDQKQEKANPQPPTQSTTPQQENVNFVSETDPVAQALKYSHNATQVSASIRKERAGTPGSEQFCSNCQFYEAVEGKPYGACSLLKNKGMVKEGGWCFSWAIKRTANAG